MLPANKIVWQIGLLRLQHRILSIFFTHLTFHFTVVSHTSHFISVVSHISHFISHLSHTPHISFHTCLTHLTFHFTLVSHTSHFISHLSHTPHISFHSCVTHLTFHFTLVSLLMSLRVPHSSLACNLNKWHSTLEQESRFRTKWEVKYTPHEFCEIAKAAWAMESWNFEIQWRHVVLCTNLPAHKILSTEWIVQFPNRECWVGAWCAKWHKWYRYRNRMFSTI